MHACVSFTNTFGIILTCHLPERLVGFGTCLFVAALS
jgi:hypothetical protein